MARRCKLLQPVQLGSTLIQPGRELAYHGQDDRGAVASLAALGGPVIKFHLDPSWVEVLSEDPDRVLIQQDRVSHGPDAGTSKREPALDGPGQDPHHNEEGDDHGQA